MAKLSDIIKLEFEKVATSKRQRSDLRYLESPIVKGYVCQFTDKTTIFAIRDMEILQKIYEATQKNVENINAHMNYSAAVLHYMNFVSFNIKNK